MDGAGFLIRKKRLKKWIFGLLASLYGTMLSWSLQNSAATQINSVISSSITGIIAVRLFPEYSAIAYAGSFAGMSSTAVIPNPLWALVLAGVVYVGYFVSGKVTYFKGMGGRLGTTAFISNAIMVLILYYNYPGYVIPYWRPDNYQNLDPTFISACLLIPVAGAMTSILIRKNLANMNHPVAAASLTGMIGSSLLLQLPYSRNTALPLQWYAGAFVGMTLVDHFPSYIYYALSGLIAGMIEVGFYGLSSGQEGGKAGLIAFISVILTAKIIVPLFTWLSPRCFPEFSLDVYIEKQDLNSWLKLMLLFVRWWIRDERNNGNNVKQFNFNMKNLFKLNSNTTDAKIDDSRIQQLSQFQIPAADSPIVLDQNSNHQPSFQQQQQQPNNQNQNLTQNQNQSVFEKPTVVENEEDELEVPV